MKDFVIQRFKVYPVTTGTTMVMLTVVLAVILITIGSLVNAYVGIISLFVGIALVVINIGLLIDLADKRKKREL